jgi:hypothetical protein
MTTTAAQIGWGGKCYLQDSGGTYVQLAEVTAIPFPEDQIADVKATHMLSPGRREEYIAGLIDGGTGDIAMNYVPGSATDVLCRDLVATGATRGLRVQLLQADGSYYEIDVNVIGKQYKRNAPIDNRMDATLTVRFTGAATETDI